MELLGLVVLTLAAFIWAWCVALFLVRGRGTPLPFAPPTEFVVQGPYRWSRNPMALSVICGAVGFSLYAGSPLGLLVSAALALVLHLFVTRVEEPGLARRFGEKYAAYCSRVPRWIPGTRPTGAHA